VSDGTGSAHERVDLREHAVERHRARDCDWRSTTPVFEVD
jgi:hypothetical protein